MRLYQTFVNNSISNLIFLKQKIYLPTRQITPYDNHYESWLGWQSFTNEVDVSGLNLGVCISFSMNVYGSEY